MVKIKEYSKIKFQRTISNLIIFMGILSLITIMTSTIKRDSKLFDLKIATNQSNEFREQRISVENIELIKNEKEDLSFEEELTLVMLGNKFNVTKPLTKNELNSLSSYHSKLIKYREKEWKTLVESYQTIWDDIEYFPVPESTLTTEATVSFEDSWYFERSYGGERHHEGTDIMANVQERGYYPVLSISDGVVEKMGWLKMGGYRIGIRSEHGAYFYYAHLESYAANLEVGDTIQAGELIGYMGDTGYSEVEGTTGKFPIHLHVGIYFNPTETDELSVNPYWILKYLEKYKLKYSY